MRRLIIYSSVSALTSLLHNVIQNPHLPTSAGDISRVAPLIDDVLPVLSQGCQTGDNSVDAEVADDVAKMDSFVGELRRRAVLSLGNWRQQFNEDTQPQGLAVYPEAWHAEFVPWSKETVTLGSYDTVSVILCYRSKHSLVLTLLQLPYPEQKDTFSQTDLTDLGYVFNNTQDLQQGEHLFNGVSHQLDKY